MAYTQAAVAPRDLARDLAFAEGARRPARGLLRRILASMQEARLRQAEREIGIYLAETGGKFTDESEREIERRILATPSRW